MIRKKFIKFIICIFSLIFTIAIIFILKEYIDYTKNLNDNKELIEKVIIEKKDEVKTAIDWKKLNSINGDIIGWIEIENTNINYPILKDDDSLKYLTHSFNGKYNKNGSIFTLNDNAFVEGETIVYGHNMRNKTMFSQLDQYMKKDFFNKHNVFNIYTEKYTYKATVFSCYSIDVYEEENNLKGLTFKDKVNYYRINSKYINDGVGEINNIVKLSTCSYLNSDTMPTNKRYYIVAKLEKID